MQRPTIPLAAVVLAMALGGFAGLAVAQSPPERSPHAPPRLDAPELRVDQVGPQPIERGRPPASAAEEAERPKTEALDDFALGDRLVPGGSLSPQAIERIQSELYRRGYDPGPRDGVMGNATRDAIKRYQADRGWPPSGKVTVRLLVALHGGDRFEGDRMPGQSVEGGLSSIDASPLVLQIQDELKRRGYDLSVDGRLDARTVRAIESYQSYFGMEPTGEASEALLDHIRSGVVPLIER